MAIKFEDNKPAGKVAKPSKPAADVEARFATPIDSDEPVNPDAGSVLPFGKMPPAEKKAKRKR